MEYKDYYAILGVERKADQEEIKRAYRRLARRYHPDVNPGDKEAQEKFKEINEAYEVLFDPEKRQKYDQLGASWQRWQRMGRDPSGFDWSRWFTGEPGRVHVEYADLGDILSGLGGFSDFFQAIFGGVGRSSGAWSAPQPRSRGRDYEQPVEITMEEAFAGTTRVLSLNGRRLEVKIPPGVRNGSKVRMAGLGGEGYGGESKGDLYLRIKVAPHPLFERKGDDLYAELSVDLYIALLGGEVRVPTLKGSVVLKIPPETQPGKTLRLKSQGMPNLKDPNRRGDLYVKVKVQIPERLTPRERELFEELRSLRL
jgi:curved DNA-binding protein